MKNQTVSAPHVGAFEVACPEGQTNLVVDFMERTGKLWEPALVEWFGNRIADVPAEDAALIDVGANIGTFSKFASLLKPGMRIMAFEPIDSQYEALVENLRHEPNAEAYREALGCVSARIVFGVPSANVGEAGQVPFSVLGPQQNLDLAQMIDQGLVGKQIDGLVDSGGKPILVQAVDMRRFDDRAERLRDVGRLFVKIDVEGMEVEVITGMAHTIMAHKPTIIVEANTQGAALEILEHLHRHSGGYGMVHGLHTNYGEAPDNVMCVFEAE